jgi:hypothetical protein
MNAAAPISAPTLQRLRISAYSGFCDVPRRIVALDREFVFWLFDCAFDDDADDYSVDYAVYRIGSDSMQAKYAFQSPSVADALPHESFASTVPVANVEFDATVRNALFVHTRRFVAQVPSII